MTQRQPLLVVGLAAALVVLAAPTPAQQATPVPRWRIDPYTGNDPELLARAGYVSYGPFPFGLRGRAPVTTTDIDAALAPAEILWVETPHFRIGSSLEAWAIPGEMDTRRKIRGELELLQQKLRKVKPKTRTLDPWLRLHLIAQRMEALYAEFLDLVGVADDEFPRAAEDVVIGRGRYLGYGPYLGMHEKYLLLITQASGPYRTYMQEFVGKSGNFGQRWHFQDIGALFYGTACDLREDPIRHDTALHGNLAFNVAHGFVDGFRHYSYDAPVWITEGIAHWFERRISPKWNSFTQSESSVFDNRPLWRWEQETRKLLAAGKGTPLSEMYTWRDFGQIDFEDHILLWSRWDYLMSLGREKFAEFMFQVKGRIDPETWLTDQSDLVGATRDALRKTYGLTPLSFDEKWKEWVIANYPAR